jgi:hypothetical protein
MAQRERLGMLVVEKSKEKERRSLSPTDDYFLIIISSLSVISIQRTIPLSTPLFVRNSSKPPSGYFAARRPSTELRRIDHGNFVEYKTN